MATWWQDKDKLVPDILIKIPTRPDETPEEQAPAEDIGSVADDNSDEFDDVKLPDRGQDQ